MLGIDHNKASIEEREVFSFTKKMTGDVLLVLKEIEGINGCIILSTCNRMELWVSCLDELKTSIFDILCSVKKVDKVEQKTCSTFDSSACSKHADGDKNQYKHCFVERHGYDAIEHLFYVTCGLKSKIIGEDQILTQVKDALVLSRENYCTDNVLETLFRIAISSAKQVKTQVHLSNVNSSVIHHVVYELKLHNYLFSGKKCLVIGNGEMGKLTAKKLMEEGAEVTVTVRQYRSGIVEIPVGCNRINYGDRFHHIEDYDMVISATASPNMTIQKEHLNHLKFEKPIIFADLAVPRDIDPQIKELSNVTLYNIDHFNADVISDEMKVQLSQIDEILKDRIEEFVSWYECRDLIPLIQALSENAAADVGLRINKTIKKIEIDSTNKELLSTSVHSATNKVVSKIIFGLRDKVNSETFLECMEALKNIY
jgi:glutamyl-tRNA reductase